ncbi:TPA: HaeIII family restriction endonuclease, partial [Haemophilus influenzae]
MSNKSNDNGRAYEFAFINELGRIATQNQNINIEKNSSYYVVEKSWNTLSDVEKEKYTKSAITGINLITSLEPIIEDGNGVLNLKIQADNKGELGDVRDILIQRENINWEIGLSLKHNHFAVKHSRLSHKIDFSEKWFQLPSSQNYWDNIIPIFEKLEIYKKDKIKW